jgi:hypothetical protein
MKDITESHQTKRTSMNASRRNSASSSTPLLALVAAFLAVPLSYAGPGIQYWRQSVDTKPDTAAKAQSVMPACSGCADMKITDISITRPDWPNGRGPLMTVAVGSQQVCQMCAAPSVTMKPAWPNGRGPLEAVALKSSHVCQTALFARSE